MGNVPKDGLERTPDPGAPRGGPRSWGYSKSPEPTLQDDSSLWPRQLPPLEQGSDSEAGKTVLRKLSASRAAYPSAILNRPNENFPVKLKPERELEAAIHHSWAE